MHKIKIARINLFPIEPLRLINVLETIGQIQLFVRPRGSLYLDAKNLLFLVVLYLLLGPMGFSQLLKRRQLLAESRRDVRSVKRLVQQL